MVLAPCLGFALFSTTMRRVLYILLCTTILPAGRLATSADCCIMQIRSGYGKAAIAERLHLNGPPTCSPVLAHLRPRLNMILGTSNRTSTDGADSTVRLPEKRRSCDDPQEWRIQPAQGGIVHQVSEGIVGDPSHRQSCQISGASLWLSRSFLHEPACQAR